MTAADLEAGLDGLRELGFEPVRATNLESRQGLFAGNDDERLAALHDLADDRSLGAIFFARGGHGVLRLLPRIDWRRVGRHPRAWVGYSDLTPFLLEIVARHRLVAFHGPMVAVDLARGLEGIESVSLLGALAGEYPASLPLLPQGGDDFGGILWGGCLSMLAATLGTPYAVPPAGAILFWEEVAEPLYRIDRMLTQLRLGGRLDAIAGMVVGHVEPAANDEAAAGLGALVRETASEGGWPVAWECPSGHGRPNLTLPLGMAARVEAMHNELRLDGAPPAGQAQGSPHE